MNGVWCLQCQVGSSLWKIYGSEEVMRCGFDEMKAAMETGDSPSVLRIDGFYDAADRAERSIIVRIAEVSAVELGKLY